MRSSQELRLARLYSKIAFPVVCAAYWAFCFTLTHVPVRTKTRWAWEIPHADKVIHFCLYFLLAMFFAFTLSCWIGKEGNRSRQFFLSVITILTCGLYGMIDEVTQVWVPSRSADLWDWLTDLAGAFAGLLAFWAIGYRARAKNREK
jgi:VanZ family protein